MQLLSFCQHPAIVQQAVQAVTAAHPGLKLDQSASLITMTGSLRVSESLFLPLVLIVPFQYNAICARFVNNPVVDDPAVSIRETRTVDTQGKVYHPMLAYWDPASHNLVALLNALVQEFQRDVPVHASQQLALPTQTRLLHAVQERIASAAHILHTQTLPQQIDALVRENNTLSQRLGKIDRMCSSLEHHERELKRLIDGLVEASHRVKEETARLDGLPDLKAETLVTGTETIHEQLLELSAEDRAYDELFYHLERALHDEIIDLPAFIKATRNNARKQFMTRQLIKKIGRLLASQ
ncbi:MAG: hypothetical protein SGCHY_003653 [Lobulomycetales sp.]